MYEMQQLPHLIHLKFSGHPSDAEMLMIAILTQLTALNIKSSTYDQIQCHLSSVVKLTSLVHLELLDCHLVDGSAHYTSDPADVEEDELVVSTYGAPFAFALCQLM